MVRRAGWSQRDLASGFGQAGCMLHVRHLMDASNRHLGVSWAFRKRGQVLVIQFCNLTAQMWFVKLWASILGVFAVSVFAASIFVANWPYDNYVMKDILTGWQFGVWQFVSMSWNVLAFLLVSDIIDVFIELPGNVSPLLFVLLAFFLPLFYLLHQNCLWPISHEAEIFGAKMLATKMLTEKASRTMS